MKMNKLMVFLGFIFIALSGTAQDGFKKIAFADFTQKLSKIKQNADGCKGIRMSTYSNPGELNAFESRAGLIISDSKGIYYGFNGFPVSVISDGLSLSVDSTMGVIFISESDSKSANQQVLAELTSTEIDSSFIRMVGMRNNGDLTVYRLTLLPATGYKYIEIYLYNQTIIKSSYQFLAKSHSQNPYGHGETYYPYLVTEYFPLKDCSQYGTLNQISTYIKKNPNSDYVPTAQFKEFEIHDLRVKTDKM